MSAKDHHAESLPQQLLQDISWTFRGTTYPDRAAFDRVFCQEQSRYRGEETGRPDEIVLRVPSARVRPDVWIADDEDPIVELTSDDVAGFTAAEIIFKVHNALVEGLREQDHKYFEGFTLASDQQEGEPPLYDLDLGS